MFSPFCFYFYCSVKKNALFGFHGRPLFRYEPQPQTVQCFRLSWICSTAAGKHWTAQCCGSEGLELDLQPLSMRPRVPVQWLCAAVSFLSGCGTAVSFLACKRTHCVRLTLQSVHLSVTRSEPSEGLSELGPLSLHWGKHFSPQVWSVGQIVFGVWSSSLGLHWSFEANVAPIWGNSTTILSKLSDKNTHLDSITLNC